MPTVTVTVQDKWLPTGKKRWVIKGTDGTMYGTPEAIAARISKGETYDVAFKIDNWQGKTYNVVEGIFPPTGPTPSAVNKVPSYTLEETYTKGTNKDEDIAVLAIVKAMQLTPGDPGLVRHALVAAAMGWREYKKWQVSGSVESRVPARPSLKDEMNDEIPERM